MKMHLWCSKRAYPRRFRADCLSGGALVSAAVLLISGLAGHAAVTVSPDIAYLLSAGRGEGLSVSHDGSKILVSTPTDISADVGLPEESVYESTVPVVKHRPRPSNPFEERYVLALEPGESTDPSVVHGRQFDLVAIRGNEDDDTPDHNALLAFTEEGILQRMPITGRPDGMKASPNGDFAVVAIEKGGEILVYDLRGGAGAIYLAARITKPALEAYFDGVPNPAGSRLEPESVGFAHDSSFALVSIQESSSVAVVDINVVSEGLKEGILTPEDIGEAALRNVVHLPYGFWGSNSTAANTTRYGLAPDGVAMSPDDSFAIVMSESANQSRHLQSFSVLDLRNGLDAITAATYSIFDIDPTLLTGTGLASTPDWSTSFYPVDAGKLPRLDPANVEIVRQGNQLVAALVIERYDASPTQVANLGVGNVETRGSVLFLDVTRALDGEFEVIERIPVGVTGARLEGVASAQQGRWIFVSISNGGDDRGTVARFQLNRN